MATWFNHIPEADDENCPICGHEQREIFENAFVGGEKVASLLDLFGASEGWAYAHARAFGFLEARVDNTKNLYGRIINDFLNHYKPKEVTAFQALKAAEMLDRVSGRLQKDSHVNGTTVVFLTAPGPRNAARVIEVKPEEVAELPPGPGLFSEE